MDLPLHASLALQEKIGDHLQAQIQGMNQRILLAFCKTCAAEGMGQETSADHATARAAEPML